jgi:hypothetical protein
LDITESGQNTLIGYRSGFNKTNSTGRNSALGFESLYSDTSGYDNIAIGYQALYSANPAYKNTAVGFSAGTWTTGNYNALLGSGAGKGVSGSSNFANTVAVGYEALTNLTTGTGNTAVGYQALKSTSTGDSNVAVGYLALANATTQARNTAVGYGAFDEINGTNNVSYSTGLGFGVDSGGNDRVIVIGHNVLALGSNSVSIGGSAGYQGTTIGNAAKNYRGVSIGWAAGGLLQGSTDHNIFIGVQSGYNGNGCSFNTFVGQLSGTNLSGGDNNVLLGYQSGYNVANGSNNIFLGYQSGYNETGSNKLYIENSNSSSPLIYGEFDNDIVRVNGTLEVTEGVTVDETGLAAAGDYGKGSEVWYQGAGATTAGSLYYLNSSGDWANTDASAASTAKGMLAFAAGTDSDVDGMVTKGFVYLGTDAGGSVGDVVYLSETANLATTTAPTTSGAIVRVLGYKVATNVIWFNPSNDWVELS